MRIYSSRLQDYLASFGYFPLYDNFYKKSKELSELLTNYSILYCFRNKL